VFPESNFDELKEKTGDQDSSKIYKIKYQINILPGIGVHNKVDGNGEPELLNNQIDFMDMLYNTEEIDIFKSKAILPFI
jgi:hypothetical protein